MCLVSQCALQSSQLTDVEYRLVRVLGSVLGLGGRIKPERNHRQSFCYAR
jgi:hypothetical protein